MNIITLRSYYGKQQGWIDLVPVPDPITGKLKGVVSLTPTERLNAVRPVDANTIRRVKDGLTLDLDNEIDAIDWAWMKHNKEIVEDLEAAASNPATLYYVDKPDIELDKKLSRFKLVGQAFSLVNDASSTERSDMCRYLGQNVSSFRPKDIEEFLLSIAEKNPTRLLKAKVDPNYKTKLMLYELLDNGQVKVDKSGIYRYGDIVLGLNLEAATIWLNDKKNRDIVGKLYIELNGPKDAVMPTSVVEEFEQMAKAEQKAKPKNNKKTGSGTGGESAQVPQVEVAEEQLI